MFRRHILQGAIALAAIIAPVATFSCGIVDLNITKSGPATAKPGDIIKYVIHVSEYSSGTAVGVTVTDQIPQGLTFLAGIPYEHIREEPTHGANAYCEPTTPGNVLTCKMTSLGANKNAPFTTDVYFELSFRVDPSLACQTIRNKATVTSFEMDSNMSNNMSNEVVTQIECNQPQLQIQKSGPASAMRGGTITYQLNVSNTGNGPAPDTVITDAVPAGLVYVPGSSDQSCNQQGQNIVCSVGTLNAGESRTLNLTFSVPDIAPEQCVTTNVTNVANVQSGQHTIQSNTVITQINCKPVVKGCIEIIKIATDAQGNPLSVTPSFTFTLDAAQNVQNASDGRARFENVNPGTHAVAEIPQNGWTLEQVSPANGQVSVSGGSQCAQVTFRNRQLPLPVPSVSISKQGPGVITAGSTISYGLIVSNNGQAAAQNVIVTDPVPYGLLYMPGSSDPACAQQGGSVVCSLGTLQAGQSRSLTLAFNVPVSRGCAPISNIAHVSGSNFPETQSPPVPTDVICASSSSSSSSSQPPQFGCIEILKEAYDADGNRLNAVPQFTFTLDGNRTAYNDANGRARFDGVTLGAHTVIETFLQDWTLQSVSPVNGTVAVYPGNACAQIVFRNAQSPAPVDFSISKTDGEDEVDPGDDLTYRITVRNRSNRTVRDVTVTDTLPDEVNFDDCSDHCTRNGRILTWSGLTFGPQEEKTFTVDVEVDEDADGELKNIARVFDKMAMDTTDVREEEEVFPAISLTKEADTAEVFPGGLITYTVRVQNTGDTDLRDLTITDRLPAGVSVVDDGNADKRGNGTLIWKLNRLDEGDSATFTYRVASDPGTLPGALLRNEVCVEADDVDDECESTTVAVIGNLPQTGYHSGTSGRLLPYRAKPSGESTLPLTAAISMTGVAAGIVAGIRRRYWSAV